MLRAAEAFKHFSLSRFSKGSRPRSYVHPKDAKNTAAIQHLQRQLMSDQLDTMAANPGASQGTTIGIPQSSVKSLFPSYDHKTGTVRMADVLSVLRRRMTGTEFYTRGAPPVVQSAQQAQIQAQVQSIIQSITKTSITKTKGPPK